MRFTLLSVLVLLGIGLPLLRAEILKDLTNQVTLEYSPRKIQNGFEIKIKRGDEEYVTGQIHTTLKLDSCQSLNCVIKSPNNIDVRLRAEPIEHGFRIIAESMDRHIEFMDYWNLNESTTSWFGGPENKEQLWPVHKLIINGSKPYVSSQYYSHAVTEPYWLNSKGLFFHVDRKTPLFIDQNTMVFQHLMIGAKLQDPYVNRVRVFLNYSVIALNDPKEAHLYAMQKYIKKPTGHPDEKMIRQPIWTTWAKYKKDIDDKTVLNFAQDIINHGFKSGQIEIDDDWEVCYGAQTFKKDKFANIANTVKTLKSQGFRVTLWIHPFVDDKCQPNSKEGKDKHYFVKNIENNDNATWWDSSDSHQIDFTFKDAQDWFVNRLKKLQQDVGIDSFKFDAGESDYTARRTIYHENDTELYPNILTENYIRTVAKFGNLIEVRSAYRTQDLPIFVRMLDKDSRFDYNNGLYTLITTLLVMNINGYTMVLPDMIGGNGYGNNKPTPELLVRWIQANAFMPAMQFSYLPWDFQTNEFDIEKIMKKFVKLHEDYADEILKAMNASITDGTPVNPPIWWVDPTNREAHNVGSQFMLGTKIMVAPVVNNGHRVRDVYLPQGKWKDGNNGTVYEGRQWLRKYPAPIDVLPYFISVDKEEDNDIYINDVKVEDVNF